MVDIDETISTNGSQASDWTPADAGHSDVAPAHGILIGDDAAAARPSRPTVMPEFLTELAVAMRSVSGRERERIAAVVADDAAMHVEKARALAAAQADAFRQMADEDVAQIEAWADGEVERIRADAARRVADRQSDLDVSLQQQEAVLQSEIDGVGAAVGAYGVKLDSFFEDLDLATDPSEIASRAGTLPRPPDLEEVRALARADALTRIAERAATGDGSAPDEVGETLADDDRPSDGGTPTGLVMDVEADTDGRSSPTEATVADLADIAGSTSVPDTAETPAGWEPGGNTAEEVVPPVARTGWEREETAEAEVAVPVAVMDPSATGQAEWPSTDLVGAQPYGHPNAAVRLIRSMAPWTAPTSSEDHTPSRRE